MHACTNVKEELLHYSWRGFGGAAWTKCKSFMLKFLCDRQGALSVELSCTWTGLVTLGNSFCYFLFSSLDEVVFPKVGSALKGKNLLLKEQILVFKC